MYLLEVGRLVPDLMAPLLDEVLEGTLADFSALAIAAFLKQGT